MFAPETNNDELLSKLLFLNDQLGIDVGVEIKSIRDEQRSVELPAVYDPLLKRITINADFIRQWEFNKRFNMELWDYILVIYCHELGHFDDHHNVLAAGQRGFTKYEYNTSDQDQKSILETNLENFRNTIDNEHRAWQFGEKYVPLDLVGKFHEFNYRNIFLIGVIKLDPFLNEFIPKDLSLNDKNKILEDFSLNLVAKMNEIKTNIPSDRLELLTKI